MKKLLINSLTFIFLISIPFAQTIEGTWKMSPVAGALGVGPAVGDIGWWSNSLEEATTIRACFFDDNMFSMQMAHLKMFSVLKHGMKPGKQE